MGAIGANLREEVILGVVPRTPNRLPREKLRMWHVFARIRALRLSHEKKRRWHQCSSKSESANFGADLRAALFRPLPSDPWNDVPFALESAPPDPPKAATPRTRRTRRIVRTRRTARSASSSTSRCFFVRMPSVDMVTAGACLDRVSTAFPDGTWRCAAVELGMRIRCVSC